MEFWVYSLARRVYHFDCLQSTETPVLRLLVDRGRVVMRALFRVFAEFSIISQFLEWILMEHIVKKSSFDTKLPYVPFKFVLEIEISFKNRKIMTDKSILIHYNSPIRLFLNCIYFIRIRSRVWVGAIRWEFRFFY